jgi:radical SAM-linked protein
MPDQDIPTKQRLLITFGKAGSLKYTSNLDIAKVWERLLRRAKLPLLYTQGFNTRPRLQLASPLPLGITSQCELVDIALKEEIALDGIRERLLEVSPPGLEIYSVETLDVRHPTLQSLVRSGEYRIYFDDSLSSSHLQDCVDTLLARDSLIKVEQRKKRKQVMDLRPLIYDLQIDESGCLLAHVAVGDQGNLRPDDLLAALELSGYPYQAHRQRLLLTVP